MDVEDFLIYGTIGIVIIVVGYLLLSPFTLSPDTKPASNIFSLKECTSAGFEKEECFKLSREGIKKIRGQENS